MKKITTIVIIILIIASTLFSFVEVSVKNKNSYIFLFKTKLQREKAKTQKGVVIELRIHTTTVRIVYSPMRWLYFSVKLLDIIIQKFIE